ncbi:MS_channel domain-containing protein [Cephalotus follicularis]|uniref:Mechanosensitive ion channel protein n=1 Tax=Cephalotus follicularis TaxID=3775 RepID=A0A1Q3D2R5_CEPFO|nr:MS_channel domain-containing protein [Cephalotus follicularis]
MDVGDDPNRDHNNQMWRETGKQFWKDDIEDKENVNVKNGAGYGGERSFDHTQRMNSMEDPPSRLIGEFLNKQTNSDEIALDMDLEMDELKRARERNSGLPPLADGSRELRVSFEPSPESRTGNENTRRQYKDYPEGDLYYKQQQQKSEWRSPIKGEDEVVRCTANAFNERSGSFQRKSTLLSRMKTKSRLLDPPDDMLTSRDLRSGRIPKSGQLKSGMLGKALEEDEDDPLADEDLPDKFKRNSSNALTFIQWLSLILIVAALICSLSIPALKKRTLWKLRLWKWEVMVLVLICGRLVSGWGIRLIVFFIERNFLLRKRVLYFVYGVRRPVQNCWWLGLVLIAWHFLFDKKVETETQNENLRYVTKVLICFLIGTLLWLIKTLMVKVLASSFHVSTYFERIQDSLFNQYVIETLSGTPLIEIQRNEEEIEKTAAEVRRLQNAGANVTPDLRAAVYPTAKSGRVIGSGRFMNRGKTTKFSQAFSKKIDNGITIDHLHKLNNKNVSAWNMKRLMNIVRHGALSTLDEQILDNTYEDESATQIGSEFEAKAAARKIFLNVAARGSKYIYLEDLLRFMREDEALKTMSLFEGASDSRRISKSSLKNWVVNAFRERRALALTLNDTKTAVNKLHHMVNVIVAIAIGIIWLLILNIATTKFFVLVSSQLVLVAFIFGNTCKTIFESIIFLFVIHPFDVGDRCEVDGVQMVVEEMNILTTVFLRSDNQKVVLPNITLSTKAIGNFYRSPDMGDAVEFCVHISTPAEKIAVIRQRITSFVESKKEHWYSAPTVILQDFVELNRLKMAVWLQHRMNHQDMGEKWLRREILVEEMVRIFKELDIQYRMLPLDINICAMPTVTSNRLPPTWTSTAPINEEQRKTTN